MISPPCNSLQLQSSPPGPSKQPHGARRTAGSRDSHALQMRGSRAFRRHSDGLETVAENHGGNPALGRKQRRDLALAPTAAYLGRKLLRRIEAPRKLRLIEVKDIAFVPAQTLVHFQQDLP